MPAVQPGGTHSENRTVLQVWSRSAICLINKSRTPIPGFHIVEQRENDKDRIGSAFKHMARGADISAEEGGFGGGAANVQHPVDPKQSQKGKVKLRPLKMLLPYLVRHKWRVLAAFIALITASAVTLALPMAVRRMIDFGFSAENADLIDQYFGMLIIVVGALAAASSLRYYLVTWLGERIVTEIRIDVFGHIMRLGADFFDQARSGEVISRLTADTTQIKSAVGVSISTALRNFVLFVGAITLMVFTSPRLAGFVLLAIPLVVLPIVFFGRQVRKKSRAAQDALAEASAFAGEAISGVREIQSVTAEARSADRYSGNIETSFSAARAAFTARAGLTAGAIFVIFTSVVLVLWVGAQDVFEGRISPGALSQFVLYSVFAAGALGELSQVWGEVSLAAGAAERLDELLQTKRSIERPSNPKTLPDKIAGGLSFDAVSFAYPTAPERMVLSNLSLTIAPGERVAIVGPSGAGKSTLFALLMRWYDPTRGQIRLEDTPIHQVDPQALRSKLALVPQETTIFAASVADNIRFAKPDASDAEVQAAAQAANAEEFIERLSHGYDTIIGERGVTLSGGQRQRLAIARAVLRNAPVLLLDEATSSLDAASEKLVQAALDHLMAGRTTLIIAHRLATILKADRIIVVDAGHVVEVGTHAELVAEGGLYARLARLQFDTEGAA